jgi:hypothetical protein
MIILASIGAIIGIVLGAMAAAWRRACVSIAKDFLILRQLRGVPGAQLNNQVVSFITSKWATARHSFAVAILIISASIAGIALAWYWGVAWFVGSVITAELVAFALPNPQSPYYSNQISEDVEHRLAAATRLGGETAIEDLRLLAEVLDLNQ